MAVIAANYKVGRGLPHETSAVDGLPLLRYHISVFGHQHLPISVEIMLFELRARTDELETSCQVSHHSSDVSYSHHLLLRDSKIITDNIIYSFADGGHSTPLLHVCLIMSLAPSQASQQLHFISVVWPLSVSLARPPGNRYACKACGNGRARCLSIHRMPPVVATEHSRFSHRHPKP